MDAPLELSEAPKLTNTRGFRRNVKMLMPHQEQTALFLMLSIGPVSLSLTPIHQNCDASVNKSDATLPV